MDSTVTTEDKDKIIAELRSELEEAQQGLDYWMDETESALKRNGQINKERDTLQARVAELEEYIVSAENQDITKEIHRMGKSSPRLGNQTYMYSGPRMLELSVGMLELKLKEALKKD